MIDSCTKKHIKIAEKTYRYKHKMKIRNAFKYSGGEDLKKVKRNASLRKCVCFLFDFLVVANKTWCFFSLCVVCCLNIWMYFTAVRICQRYHITWFLSFMFLFLKVCFVFWVPELWPILFRKLEINGEFDIMLSFHISIVNITVILFPGFELTVKY